MKHHRTSYKLEGGSVCEAGVPMTFRKLLAPTHERLLL